MQAEARPRMASRARAGSGREEGGGGKTAIDLYVTLGPPASSLKALSSSDRLGRPRRLSSQYTQKGNRGFLKQTCRLVFYFIIIVKSKLSFLL